jgi:hypothetical protein
MGGHHHRQNTDHSGCQGLLRPMDLGCPQRREGRPLAIDNKWPFGRIAKQTRGRHAVTRQYHVRHAARAKVENAMAHPTRMAVVDELSRHGRRRVCELTDMIGADRLTVSRHLAVRA